MKTTTISDFKKEKVIGKGSFGSVYLVRRLIDNKIYALKTVLLDKLNKKEQENSVNEVRILASIKNPYVIGYKEAFWDDNNKTLNIVMEYADDGDLQTKIRKMRHEGGFFKESLVWEYAIQMIRGLKSLHDKKIMHRDLKSANIFLFKKNNLCKLGDMNVSKVIKDKVLLTQTGTPYYASPEVWRDESYSYKSDLWSIGCVIYELCEQHPPFMGKNLDELFEEVCKGKPKRINRIYSDELWKVIMMLLQTDVEKRADCDIFLNCKIIKEKIKEIRKNKMCNKNNSVQINTDSGILLSTIKFDNLNDLKYQLPSTKNYESQFNENNKENINMNKIKNPLMKKLSMISHKTSRNKINVKTEGNQIKKNFNLLEKIKAMHLNKDLSKFRLNIPKNAKKLFLVKNKSKREIKPELNLEQKNNGDKLIFNKSEIFEKNKTNKNTSKGKINLKENLYNKIPKSKYSINKSLIPIINNINITNSISPTIKLYKENKCSKINYNNNILQSIPISTSTSNINKNQITLSNCLSLDMSHDISKQLNCIITQTTKNNCNNSINLIPICHKQRNRKDIIKKVNTKLIKRKNTFSKERKKEIKIKEKIDIAPLLIKRNKSLNLETYKNIKTNKPRHKKNNLSLNSLNINNIYYYRKYNMINKNEINKNSIKHKYHHQRFPTISSVQYAILNNFNNYKIISSNLRNNKKGNNQKTISNQLHKNINYLTNNKRNKIQYKKINLNINKKERRINSFINYTEKSINNSEVFDDINNKMNLAYNLKKNNNSCFINKDINKLNSNIIPY